MKVFFVQYKRLPRVGRLGFVVEFIVVGFKSFLFVSLRSRRLEVVGTRKNGRSRPLACLPRARPFSLSPAPSKRLLRRLSLCCFSEFFPRGSGIVLL